MRSVPVPLFALALMSAGCPHVPEGEVRVEDGSLPATPGATVSLGLYCDQPFGGWELVSGPGHCGRDWQVHGQAGGSDAFGTITRCGEYTAPVTRPPQMPEVLASDCDWGGGCTDACGAFLTITLNGYPDP
jgi:hypothetical protein